MAEGGPQDDQLAKLLDDVAKNRQITKFWQRMNMTNCKQVPQSW